MYLLFFIIFAVPLGLMILAMFGASAWFFSTMALAEASDRNKLVRVLVVIAACIVSIPLLPFGLLGCLMVILC